MLNLAFRISAQLCLGLLPTSESLPISLRLRALLAIVSRATSRQVCGLSSLSSVLLGWFRSAPIKTDDDSAPQRMLTFAIMLPAPLTQMGLLVF